MTSMRSTTPPTSYNIQKRYPHRYSGMTYVFFVLLACQAINMNAHRRECMLLLRDP